MEETTPGADAGEPQPTAPEAPPASLPEKTPWLLLVSVTFASAAADLVTKGWAKAALTGAARGGGSKRFDVIPGYLDFVYAQNPGGAWSFLRGLPEYVRRPFFLFISAAAIVFIVTIYRRVRPEQWAMRIGLPLALGGAIGNLVDRIRYGYVIDFIHAWMDRGGREYHWPTFNVADVAICIGVALMGIDMLSSSRRARREALEAAPVAPASDRVPS